MSVRAESDTSSDVELLEKNFLKRIFKRTTQRETIGPLGKRRERWFFIMIAPWIIGFLVFQAGPILVAGLLSVGDYSNARGFTWVGLENYRVMLDDPLVRETLGNTIYYTFVSVPFGLVVAFALAFLLNQKVRGSNIFRTIFFLPSVIQGVAVFMLWGWIFNPRFGLINNLLKSIGITGPGWLHDEQWAMPTLILMSLWSIGWMMLVYLAGLQDIPQELYEASELDGASAWQKLRYITIPLISPVTFFLFITGIIGSMQVFAPAYVLTRGGPNYATTTISLLIYFAAFLWDRMGYAAALAVLLFIFILIITLIQFGVARRWVYYASEVE
jgi:multiple sugar transport system permease protein